MTRRWCFSTLGCPELTLDAALELADRFGIAALELRALNGSLDLPGYFREYERNEPAAFRALRGSGRIVGINTSFGLAVNTPADRDALLEQARLADSLGATQLRLFGGFPLAEPFTPDRLRHALDTLAWWHDCRVRYGFSCDIILEVHDGFSSSDRCRELRNAAPYPLRFIWDLQHSHFAAGETLEYTWERIGGAVGHVHLRDAVLLPDGEIRWTLPGTGKMPVKQLLALLDRNGYDGLISLEWEKYWHPELAELPAVLEAAVSAGWFKL